MPRSGTAPRASVPRSRAARPPARSGQAPRTAPPRVTPSHVRSRRRVPYCFPMRTGLGEGDRVALLVPPSPEYLDVVLGLLAAGVVPIPLDPRLTAFERERIL